MILKFIEDTLWTYYKFIAMLRELEEKKWFFLLILEYMQWTDHLFVYDGNTTFITLFFFF